jgi:AcrR family transcriptional regulator
MPTDDEARPHRRRPLAAADVRARMLAAAQEIVAKTGVTVRVEDLSLEQVIQYARVPRSSVYRIWPYKEDFLDDLLCHLAGPDWLGGTAFDEQTIAIVTQVVADNRHRLGTAAGRREVLCEAVRQGVRRNLQAVIDSRERRIFTALGATLDSLRDADVRQRVQAELERTEINLLTRMSEFYRDITAALGLRPRRPEYTLQHIAAAGAALVEGFALRARVVVEPRTQGQEWTFADVIRGPLPGPGLDGQVVGWSSAAIAFLGLIDMFLEPDPDFTGG